MFQVRQARRQRRPLKISLEGLSGSGKTFSALRLAFAMRRAGIGSKIVVADSENESAGLYDGVQIDGEVWQYQVCPIPHEVQNPKGYADCYEYLVGAGFDLVIFDSLSHAWHGAMQQVDDFARANRGDKFGGWAKVTPDQRHMLDTLTDPRAHCIVTMRVKSEYERVDANGKAQIKKVGMKTDQRDNTEYEFDAVIRIDQSHEAHVEKVRGCSAMDNKSGVKPGPEFWKPLFDWWLSAEPVVSTADQLADVYAERIAATTTLDALRTLMGSVNGDAKAGLLGEDQVARLADAKERAKVRLAPKPVAAPEGDHRPDPTLASASTASTPSPSASATSSAPSATITAEPAATATTKSPSSQSTTPTERPEETAFKAEFARTGIKWAKCVKWLNARYPGSGYTTSHKLDVVATEHLASLVADLKTHAAPVEKAGVA